LNDEEVLSQFDKIEKRVEQLIETCRSLEAANVELNNKYERLKQEAEGKADAEKRYLEQRDLIRSKVDSLLSRLNSYSE
jgi:FtsZ-binding cell division protein ZapB